MPTPSEINQVLDANMVPVILNDGRVEVPVEVSGDNRVLIIDRRIHSYH